MTETLRTDYYVYAYLRQRDSKRASAGTPYYIGKGQGNRIHEKIGHPFLPKREKRIKIAENLTEQDALDLEMKLIEEYGRIKYDEGGILYNIVIGGVGNTKWRTLEEKKKATYETKKRWREKNRELVIQIQKEYREKNRELVNQIQKEYREKNREEINRKAREWRATPEGKAKNVVRQKKYIEETVKKDPVKFEQLRKIQRKNSSKYYYKNRDSRLRYAKKRYDKIKKGVKPKEECRKKVKVISPEGVIYEVIQRKSFAEKHNLNRSCFINMIRGYRSHHKGWKVYEEPTSNRISVTDFMI